ncbi:MAG TPA: Ger(x)C family spore germination protein [Bacillota bacterium]
MKKFVCINLIWLVFLSGCWDIVELDESIMVLGVGLSKTDENEYNIVVEATAPSAVAPTEGASAKGRSILLEVKSKTLFDAAREVIRIAKRRLFFTHAHVWIIHSDLATDEDVLYFLDILRREQMLRLNSFLFVTDETPKDIFSVAPIFSNIISEQLTSAMEFVDYVSDYPAVRAREFFRMLLNPIKNGYLPYVRNTLQSNEIHTEFTGAGIFNEGKLVGKLNLRETFGLLWLNDETQGGNITISKDGDKTSFKLLKGKTKIKPHLDGERLQVDIHVKARGKLADQNVRHVESINEWIKQFSELIEERIEKDMRHALHILQHDLKTDATAIGLNVYRKQPDAFKQVSDRWDEVFADADVRIHVETIILDKGLIERPGYRQEKPLKKNPYQLNKGR